MDRFIIFLVMIGFTAAFTNCWNMCGQRPGQCSRCAEGSMCCRFGWGGGGCPKYFGCGGFHCCYEFDCWNDCRKKGGRCRACVGSASVCCRKGFSGDPIECGRGIVGCNNRHCCVKPATDAQICGTTIDKNWRFVDIHYDIERSALTRLPPEVAGNQYIDNSGGSTQQEIAFTAVETFEETKSFTHTTGISISVGVTFSAGVPLVSQGRITTTISTSYDFTYGKEYSESKQKRTEFRCKAAAGKKVRCLVTYNEFKVDIPYTATWKRKDLPNECTKKIGGVYSEVSAFDMHMHVSEV